MDSKCYSEKKHIFCFVFADKIKENQDICNILKPNNSEVDEMPNFTLREEGCDEDDDDGDDGSPKHRLRSIVMAQRLRSSSGQICKLPSCLKTVTSQNDIKELTRSSLAEFLTQVSGLNFPRVASEPEADVRHPFFFFLLVYRQSRRKNYFRLRGLFPLCVFDNVEAHLSSF